MNKALKIVEQYSHDLLSQESVISITPMASYFLEKNNIEYDVMYPSHGPNLHDQDTYFDLQITWLEKLDSLFSKHMEILPRETKHYWLYQIHFLKSVMDILPIQACQFLKIIREERPKNVQLYTYASRIRTPGHSLNFIGEPTAAELVLREASERYGFNLEIIKSIAAEESYCLTNDEDQMIIGKAKKILNAIYRIKENVSCIKHSLRKNDHQLNILACQNGYDIPDALSQMRSKGHRTYVFNNRSLYLNSSPYSGKEVFAIDDDEFRRELERQKDKLENIVQVLDKDEWYLQWYDDFCGLPMSKHLIPTLRKFAIDELSQVFAYEKFCKYILNEFHIDYLITSNVNSHSDFGFILASKDVATCDSVAIMHGNCWFQARIWDYSELYPFDIYFAADQELENYFGCRVRELKLRTEVHKGGGRFQKNYLKNLARKAYAKYTYRRKHKRIFEKSNLPLVVYVPTVYMGNRRVMNFPYYPDSWYFELQKAIITACSKQHDFNFVVKKLKDGDSVQSPLQHYLNEFKSDKMLLRDDLFINWLYNADIFIFDFPSTALYEVMALEKPFFVLLHDTNSIRNTISNYINDKIQERVGKFNNMQEVEALISKFLSTYKSVEKTSYETSNTKNIVSVLEKKISL